MASALISPEMLWMGRGLVNTAVRCLNGYMNYLKGAGKKAVVGEDLAEYATANQGDTCS